MSYPGEYPSPRVIPWHHPKRHALGGQNTTSRPNPLGTRALNSKNSSNNKNNTDNNISNSNNNSNSNNDNSNSNKHEKPKPSLH